MAQPNPAQVPLNPLPVPRVPLGSEPATVTCPSCGATVRSTVRIEPTTQTHIIAFLLCCLCIFCTCIPYLVDSCQGAHHYCPNCEAYLGSSRG